MITQRFNINRVWDGVEISNKHNTMFMGFTNLLNDLVDHFKDQTDVGKKMIEVGAYMGESTFLFACSGLYLLIDKNRQLHNFLSYKLCLYKNL